jgi:hypothetical protein
MLKASDQPADDDRRQQRGLAVDAASPVVGRSGAAFAGGHFKLTPVCRRAPHAGRRRVL